MNRLHLADKAEDAQVIHLMAITKGDPPHERYIIIWDERQRTEVLRQLGRWASNEQLSFTWYDAAVISSRIREENKEERDGYTGV